MCSTAANADDAHAIAANMPPTCQCGVVKITTHPVTIRATTTAHATPAFTFPRFTYSSITSSPLRLLDPTPL